MALYLSSRCTGISPSATLAVDTRAKQLRAQGKHVYGFGVGEPDFPTPEYICEAVREALISGQLLGAGLDTLAPEPTPADHPLVALPDGVRDRVVLAPHLGGITTGSFRRAHRTVWGNIAAVLDGKRPVNIVNGL